MKRRIFLTAGATALLAGGVAIAPDAPAQAQTENSRWAIGPIIRGENYSYRMPAFMRPARGGASFDFPYPTAQAGHVHYITTPTRPLAGAQSITIRYRIDAQPGVRFVPEEHPDRTATMSLYFQRAGDRWTMRTPHHRWYAPGSKAVPLRPGTHEVTIRMDEPWIAMTGGDSNSLPRAYAQALAQTTRVGFVFGSAGGRGHGVFATGPARFTLLDFRID